MKAQLTATAVLIAVSNFAAANGGLAIDSVEQHMNANDWVATQADQPNIAVQGPLDRFQDYVDREITVVDVNRLKQNYDGQT